MRSADLQALRSVGRAGCRWWRSNIPTRTPTRGGPHARGRAAHGRAQRRAASCRWL